MFRYALLTVVGLAGVLLLPGCGSSQGSGDESGNQNEQRPDTRGDISPAPQDGSTDPVSEIRDSGDETSVPDARPDHREVSTHTVPEFSEMTPLKIFGSESGESLSDLATDPAGNVYITGTAQTKLHDACDQGDTCSAEHGYVIKIGQSGVMGFYATLKGAKQQPSVTRRPDVQPTSIAVDEDGNVYVGGKTHYEALDGADGFAGGRGDGFLVKFDSEGTWSWGKHLGGPKRDEVQDVVTGKSGSVVVTGSTDKWTKIPGDETPFIGRYSQDGKDEWLKPIDSLDENLEAESSLEPMRLAIGKQGRISVAGKIRETRGDKFVAAFDRDGSKGQQSFRAIIPNQIESAQNPARLEALSAASNGNIHLSLRNVPINQNLQLQSYSRSDQKLWTNSVIGEGKPGQLWSGSALVEDVAGGIIAMGTVDQSINGSTHKGKADGYAVYFNREDGTKEKTKLFGTVGREEFQHAAVSGDTIVVAGETSHGFGEREIKGSRDLFVGTIDLEGPN